MLPRARALLAFCPTNRSPVLAPMRLIQLPNALCTDGERVPDLLQRAVVDIAKADDNGRPDLSLISVAVQAPHNIVVAGGEECRYFVG